MARVTKCDKAHQLDGLTLLLAVMMMEVTADNLRSRFLGLLPDEFFWADLALMELGFCVDIDDEWRS